MYFRRRLLKSKKGAATMVGAVFMLMIMFSAIIALVFAFSNFSQSGQVRQKEEYGRIQESITIAGIQIDNITNKIKSINVNNTGTIEVRIRAIYQQQGGSATFLTDPSISANTYISVGSNKSIDITSLALPSDTTLIAATERGVKSVGVNRPTLGFGSPLSNYDTSQFSIGPLMLSFTSLSWTSNFDGSNNPLAPWHPGWTAPSNTKIAWRIDVRDVDTKNRDLTLNKFSGYTINKFDNPQTTTWYINQNTVTLNWNQTTSLYFIWDLPLSNSIAKPSPGNTGVNNAFLTLFGDFQGGETFAQTIPFESITVT